jgi:hypothetical protein
MHRESPEMVNLIRTVCMGEPRPNDEVDIGLFHVGHEGGDIANIVLPVAIDSDGDGVAVAQSVRESRAKGVTSTKPRVMRQNSCASVFRYFGRCIV